MAKKDEAQQGEAQNQKQEAPKLGLKEALTADMGSGDSQEARELGYAGYVWEEDKSPYTVEGVTQHDFTGPDKAPGEYDLDRAMEDHFIRPDKLDEGGSKKK